MAYIGKTVHRPLQDERPLVANTDTNMFPPPISSKLLARLVQFLASGKRENKELPFFSIYSLQPTCREN
jgi:hypothetical protein